MENRDFKREEIRELAELLFVHKVAQDNDLSHNIAEVYAKQSIRHAMTFRMMEDKVFGAEPPIVPQKADLD